MSQTLQVVAIVVSLAFTAVGIALFVRAIRKILAVVRIGQPIDRTNEPAQRTKTLVKETLGHTRMLQWTRVGAAHWFIMVGFGLLFFTLVNAFGQLFDPHFILPLIGHFPPFEWVTEVFAWMMIVAIVPFIVYRATRPKERARGEAGRFFGSRMWWGYFVETVILTVGICILLLRFLEYALAKNGDSDDASLLHFPFTAWAGELFADLSVGTLENLVLLVAMIKIVISFTWMIVISLNANMGVAWHRFLAFFNIWFKREADGSNALGALKPIVIDGKPFDLEMVDEMDEDTAMGVGKIEDFAWKGILDFNTCTECGRCQSQCPAWNTDKPLSPKMVILNLRDHAHAKAPYLLASEEQRTSLPDLVKAEAERPLVGSTEGPAWAPDAGAVIDEDVLWSCTSCGACVQQCPVDIEHVDHIVDMRRYQVLIESSFPSELNGLFKGLENKGNPWNMSPNSRLEWAQDLPFDVKVVGEDIESLDEVDWLFWVGCAGAYEDRAKKTTRAVAELLDLADVSFGVLGNGETCSGDPARRAGNEFIFQQLAMQNAEMFKETKVKKVVSTCAHCFNTLKNEYSQFGVELEVVHHTQLLNRLVREGKLTPVAANGGPKRSVTYHDPCYIGRHNKVYEPPRELLEVIPSTEFKEMERSGDRSFCCGAGGARMWMEERIGERINVNRTTEAVGTGADQIAVACPFCRVMLSDGLTALQAKGEAREEVEVLDVAQMLLASVKRAPEAPEDSTETGDEEADDAGIPLTVRHDGTEDPEQAPDRLGEEQTEPANEREEAAPGVDDPSTQPAASSEPSAPSAHSAPSGAHAAAAVGATVAAGTAALRIELPAGQATVAETWSGLDVESILEGDEVDISEFKTKLKAELKAEVLAEIKQELAGALNSDSGVSEPVTAETVSTSAPAAAAAAPVAGSKPEPEPEAAPEPVAKSEPEPEPAPEPAAEKPAEEPKQEPAPEAKKEDGDDGPLLIGSL
ncbi:(Fe-S)-binding protein [Nocardioides caldifontis]|uniref:(Fe-S)-binding protein n=1 Tax=Nocardioides caldifontis TaxID=2588938 RepID=UPI001EF117F4|nr:(Fe-S)-binding protein [Nocardioides caldifontis]